MTKIILADADRLTSSVLAERISALRCGWDVSCMSNGHDIMQLSVTETIDCVITEVTLEDMNGFELLRGLQIRSPDTVRLTLTRELDQEVVLESTRTNQRFINRAVSDDVLVNAIDSSLRLRQVLTDNRLKQAMSDIRNLPALPDIYQQMVAELTAPQSSLQKVGTIIESDTALTATVLKIVNSAFYGLNQQVNSVAQAVALLGVHLIKNITLTAKVFMQFEAADIDIKRLRRINDEANKSGALCNQFAKLAHAPKSVVDHSQIAGMLCNIGQLIALLKPSTIDPDQLELCGAYLMSQWLLPDAVVEAIALQNVSPPPAAFAVTPLLILHAFRYLEQHLQDINDATQQQDCLEYLQTMVEPELAQRWLRAFDDLQQLTDLGDGNSLRAA